MERDFMGLNSKEPLAVVKEEIDDGGKDSAYTKGSGMQWPFLNKVPALPHFMASKVAQEDWGKKIGSEPHASSGFMTISAADAFDLKHKSSMGEFQGVASIPLYKSHFAAAGHNLAVGGVKEHSISGVPLTNSHSMIPSLGSAAGFAEQWNNLKASGAPAQLTIFYAGSVKVYDDVSPEKAQAIMFLAGNGTSIASNIGHSRPQAQAPIPKAEVGDGVLMNQPVNTPPCSALSSPISVSSHPVPQSGSGSTSSDELIAAKPAGVSAAPVKKLEPPHVVSSIGAVAAKAMMPSAVPQARKASLARFLEKRKERVMNMAPYNLAKKAQECATAASNGMGLPAAPCAQ